MDRIQAIKPGNYGFFQGEESRKESTKKQTKFVIITGSKDFRYGNLLDIFHGGYEKDGYAAKFIDTPGMEHEICKGKQLKESLEFLDSTPIP